MAQRTREFDWSSTPVGLIDNWPQSLRTTVSIMLRSKFPMFIWWGPELIQFYNDAYMPSMGNDGKHPAALGQRGEECWPEIWPVIYPLIKQVMDGGEATWSEDQLIPIYRNGHLEDVYWTFSYNAIISERGTVGGVLVVCYENTEKMVHYQKVVESESMLSFAIDAAELATWDLNPITNKFTSNDRLKSWFGLQPKDEIELPIAIAAMIEEDRDRVAAAIQRALEYSSGGFYDITYTIVNKHTAESRIVRAKGRATFNEEKIACRFNGTLQDITEQEMARLTQKEFAEELTKQVKERTLELQRSNNDLLQFAHVISHDLKEPVRKVKIFSTRIQDEHADKLPDPVSNYLNRIQSATRRMSSMIEGVLNYSRLNSFNEETEAVDLNDIVQSIQDDLEVVIQQKGASINHDPLPTIQGAPVLLYQLFYNIINNSLKFSRQGVASVITLSSVTVKEDGREVAQITVADNGIGFDPAHANAIFDSFIRLNSKDRYEGRGWDWRLARR